MNVRVCILVSLLLVFSGIFIYAAVGHSLGIPDSGILASEAEKVVSVKSPEQNKRCIMSSNIVVSWKSEVNGQMMKASLSQEQAEQLGALMAAGQTFEHALGQMKVCPLDLKDNK
jgi:hypothetical protein